MYSSNEKPPMQTVANETAKNHYVDSKRFAYLRKDINELIILVDKLHEQIAKNNGGHL